MNKVFVGGISPEGEQILNQYLSLFMPDAVIEPLKAVGIKGRIKNHAIRPDVALVIIDESLYNACVGVADDVLSLPKVHKYVDDDGLKQFLISKFGKIDDLDSSKSEGFINNKEVVPDVDNSIPDLKPIEEDFGDMNLANSSEEVEDKDSIISKLQDELAEKEMLIRNLERQASDSTSDDEISALCGQIRKLKEQLDEKDKQLQSAGNLDYEILGKVTWAEKHIDDVKNLEAELKSTKEEKSELEFTKTKLSDEIESLNKEVSDLNSQLAELNNVKNELNDCKSKLDESNSLLEAKDLELNGKSDEINILNEKVSELESTKSALSDSANKVSELELSIKNLGIDLQSKEKQLSGVVAELTEAKLKIDDLETALANKTKEFDALNEKYISSDDSLIFAQNEINSLRERLAVLEKELQSKVAENDKLSADLQLMQTDIDNSAEKDSEINELNGKIADYEDRVKDLSANIITLESKLSEKDRELTELKNVSLIREEAEKTKSEAFDKLMSEKGLIEDELVNTQEAKLSLETKISNLNSQIAQLSNDNEAKDKTINELKEEGIKSNNTITSMQEQLSNNKVESGVVQKLETELLEEKRKSARLSSELDVMKKTDDSGKSVELRLEITRLKNELEVANNNSVNVEELEATKSELQSIRERNTTLELDLADKDELLKEYSSGVFAQMANIALPKLAYDCKATEPTEINGSNFVCVVSGSAESSISAYQMMRRTCQANSNKKCLILDLVNDSCIDREFGTDKIISPIEWLNNIKPFTDFTSNTKLRNVKVITTGLAYLNDLYLLQVDWNKKLKELQGYADVVFIHIGCLNNLVTKVLFNTFSSYMKSYVVVKATPINIRTVILNLTGFKSLSDNITVSCINFDANSSKQLYQRLAQKYKAQIYRDQDVLEV